MTTTPKLDMEQASNGPQCDSYSTSRESRCVLDEGHDSDHRFKQARESWQIEIERLTTLASTQAARIVELEAEVAALKADEDAVASQRIRDHVEYKQRRNAQFAAYELAHRATIAFLLDRAEQYAPDSGYRAFVDELVGGIASFRHVECAEAGEYDDMRKRIDRILTARTAARTAESKKESGAE